ncbi:hypothetical protein [Roseiconus lacunae]|uniref:Transmembrane protein n=1 Tax=Roseiconus lacunae TaxID=2605694 RepID=A0ABT7PEL9_9BACT|nr:hypothetical protein [Roseiconus lacunae]MCD0460027.1 hypothetical protein [Roseiconus lacunae]MDM4014934.1 hypothetical protein [Roseiconus lacunae]
MVGRRLFRVTQAFGFRWWDSRLFGGEGMFWGVMVWGVVMLACLMFVVCNITQAPTIEPSDFDSCDYWGDHQ